MPSESELMEALRALSEEKGILEKTDWKNDAQELATLKAEIDKRATYEEKQCEDWSHGWTVVDGKAVCARCGQIGELSAGSWLSGEERQKVAKMRILEQIADRTPICCVDVGCGEVCEQNVMEAIALAYDKGVIAERDRMAVLLGEERKAHDATSLKLMEAWVELRDSKGNEEIVLSSDGTRPSEQMEE